MNNGRAIRTLVAVFTIAVALNFLWEVGQSFLYAPMGTLWQGTGRCFRASLGDGLMPVLPGLGVGLVPVLQMGLLPAIAIRLAAAWELVDGR